MRPFTLYFHLPSFKENCMASNQNNPQKKNQRQDQGTNPQAQGKQQEQGQRNQPGQQDRQNVNKASDAQLNQGDSARASVAAPAATRAARTTARVLISPTSRNAMRTWSPATPAAANQAAATAKKNG
jgi:hypothetical protein